jgi:hypothetical protein
VGGVEALREDGQDTGYAELANHVGETSSGSTSLKTSERRTTRAESTLGRSSIDG